MPHPSACSTRAAAGSRSDAQAEDRRVAGKAEETRAALDAPKATTATVTTTEGLVADLMSDLAGVGWPLTSGTLHEQRDVVRAVAE